MALNHQVFEWAKSLNSKASQAQKTKASPTVFAQGTLYGLYLKSMVFPSATSNAGINSVQTLLEPIKNLKFRDLDLSALNSV